MERSKRLDLNAPRANGFEPITTWQNRRMTPGSWLSDLVALHKALVLCKGCAWKLQPKRLEYGEMKQFHCDGLCDGCQSFGSAAMWLWTGGNQWQEHAFVAKLEAKRRQQALMNNFG